MKPDSTDLKQNSKSQKSIPVELQKIVDARHHNPFSVLGRHTQDNVDTIRVHIPAARDVYLTDIDAQMLRLYDSPIFEWQGPSDALPENYRLEWYNHQSEQFSGYDPYSFPAQIADFDLHLFSEGRHWHAYRIFGAHKHSIDGIEGILFAVWAPNAARVSVVGEFNHWDGRYHPMRNRGGNGIWELFIPELKTGLLYKYELLSQDSNILIKTDPYAQSYELRPNTAAITTDNTPFLWQDQDWMEKRKQENWLHAPMSTYEVHLGSWRRSENGEFLNYVEMAKQLVEYVKTLGFTHIQLLPITEHPLDASWGYQSTGYFAPTSRFGSPDDFRFFVNLCHNEDIGVLLDWVPAHFPKDSFGLAEFDGSSLYEHEDPRRGEHRDWGTYIYNYGRNEVKNFLLSSALFWLEEFHIDGLRVDAVASMLYLDYSREKDDWLPNIYGGNENLEAIDFIKELNSVIHGQFPGCLAIAEESTAWPQVTRPTWLGGLGFSMKWNMGWMHDTLTYMGKDPVYRQYHHDQLTFGLLYSFNENFVLPLSHDEVVHGKGSLLNKMPGDEWQKFANLRLLYLYMFAYPGKKILFMGCEIAQHAEWNFDTQIDWPLLENPLHQGIQKLITDLNTFYKQTPELYKHEFQHQGFEWVDCLDANQSIISFKRRDGDRFVLVVLNFTPTPHQKYRLGLDIQRTYRVVFNSDSEYYGGSNVGNHDIISTEKTPWMGKPYSITLTIPPLAGVILEPID